MRAIVGLEVPVAGGALACRAHLPDRIPAPVVVCCHGLLSHKDSRKYTAAAARMAACGLAAVRFDFSGCGESTTRSGPILDTRLADLKAVVDHALDQSWSTGKLGLFGSSMGGYLALLLAAQGSVPVEALVCWATPFSLERVQAAVEQSGGLVQRLGGFEGFGAPMTLEGLPPVGRGMVVHGQQDERVPWRDAVAIYRQLGEPKRLMLLEGADHRLTDPGDRRLALDATLDWLSELLPQPCGTLHGISFRGRVLWGAGFKHE